MIAATARHRRALVLFGVVLAVVAATLTELTGLVFAVVPVALLILAAVALWQPRPAELVVRPDPPAFTTAPRASPVFFALAFLVFLGDKTGGLIRDREAWIPDVVVCVALVLVLVVYLPIAWRGFDLYLRPDGLHVRRVLGTLSVPWDASPAAHVRYGRAPAARDFPPGALAGTPITPSRHAVRVDLTYGQPELVRRRGLAAGSNALRSENVDLQFLSDVIAHYAAHPEDRAGIGTEDGYRRLRVALRLS